MTYITDFFRDPRVLAILGLIMLDILLGVARAIRQKEFNFRQVGDFYLTMILPYVLGYLAFYLAAKIIVSPELLGPMAVLIGEGMITVAWLAIVLALGGSTVENARGMGYQMPDQGPGPPGDT